MQNPKPNTKNTKKIKALAWGLFVFLSALSSSSAQASEDCPKAQEYAAKAKPYQDKFQDEKQSQTTRDNAKSMIELYERLRQEAISSCVAAARAEDRKREEEARNAKKAQLDEEKCNKNNADALKDAKMTSSNLKVYEWKNGECLYHPEKLKKVADDDACNKASLFEGELQGENCKRAAQTIKDTQTRSQAINETATAGISAYTQMQAMQATGQQADAQAQQQKNLQALAMVKILQGGLALTDAAQLKSAAGGAESAKEAIDGRYSKIKEVCKDASDDEACFYANAKRFNLEPDRASFDRMKSGASQSQAQADEANALAKTSMVSGLADTIVGLQALQMARQAQQNAQGLGQLPVGGMAPPPTVQFRNGQSGTTLPALNNGATAAAEDFGVPGEDGLTLGGDPGGRIQGGMRQGKSFGTNSIKPFKSTVTGSGGGGRGGGGGGGGGGAPKKAKVNNRGTSLGEYSLAGGLGAPAGAGKDTGPGGANAFAEALAKLFPKDENGKPIVDANEMAALEDSQGEAGDYERDPASEAEEATIFEQIKMKYTQLSSSGKI